MSDKNSQNPLSGLKTGTKPIEPVTNPASIPEDADKSLGETNPNQTLKAQPAASQPMVPPPGVVQDDNKPSNDHGQADPENTEISEFEESKRQALSGTVGGPTVDAAGNEDAGIIASYTSYPISNYRLGKEYRFDKGVLHFTDSEKLSEFESLLEELPMAERNRIKKLDVKGAAEISRKIQANQPGATKATDSSVGERGIKPKVGTGTLGVDGQTGEVK